VEGQRHLGLSVQHQPHGVHDDVGPVLAQGLAGAQRQGDLPVLDQPTDLIGVQSLEIGAEVAGVIEVDVEDGGALVDAPRRHGGAVGQ